MHPHVEDKPSTEEEAARAQSLACRSEIVEIEMALKLTVFGSLVNTNMAVTKCQSELFAEAFDLK